MQKEINIRLKLIIMINMIVTVIVFQAPYPSKAVMNSVVIPLM